MARFWVIAGITPSHADAEASGAAAPRRSSDRAPPRGRREYLVGDRYTIADIGLYAYTHVAPEGGFELDAYPAINAWLERVRARPGHILISD